MPHTYSRQTTRIFILLSISGLLGRCPLGGGPATVPRDPRGGVRRHGGRQALRRPHEVRRGQGGGAGRAAGPHLCLQLVVGGAWGVLILGLIPPVGPLTFAHHTGGLWGSGAHNSGLEGFSLPIIPFVTWRRQGPRAALFLNISFVSDPGPESAGHRLFSRFEPFGYRAGRGGGGDGRGLEGRGRLGFQDPSQNPASTLFFPVSQISPSPLPRSSGPTPAPPSPPAASPVPRPLPFLEIPTRKPFRTSFATGPSDIFFSKGRPVVSPRFFPPRRFFFRQDFKFEV